MARSIQWKMIIMYLLLILLAMELVGFYLLQSLERYYLNNFSSTLNSQAQLIAGFVDRYLADETKSLGGLLGDFESLVREFGQQVEIVVVNKDGFVVAASGSSVEMGSRLRQPEVSRALAGERGEGTRLDPESGERLMAVAVPIRAAGQVAGALYLSASLERIYRTIWDVRLILLSATALALVVTAVLGSALSRTITGPIREITSQAAQMAAGNFDRRIRVRSEDEIGQLASMFNHLAHRLRDTLGEVSSEKSKMEAILTHMADGILALDAAGRVILINPAASRMLGVEGAEGQPASELLQGLDLTAGGTGELRLNRRVLHVHVAPFKGLTAGISGLAVVLQDVTEQEELAQAQREFLANASHELRTPLTTIKSYVETLLDGALDDRELGRQFLKVVASETNRMTRLVTDLLRLSRLDSHSLNLDLQPFSLSGAIEDALTRLAMAIDKKQLRIERRWTGDFPPVMADRDQVVQVMLNIIGNAVEFTPPGGMIEIALREVRGGVEVRVADTGIGIPAGDLPRIFDRFYRVDKARSRELGGTGLGLSIAREIIRAHGGEIGIKSSPGAGTTVTFALPLGGPGEGSRHGQGTG